MLQDAIAEFEKSDGRGADIAIAGPLEGGEGSDIEDLHDDDIVTDGNYLPLEVAGESTVFLKENSSSDRDNSSDESPEPLNQTL